METWNLERKVSLLFGEEDCSDTSVVEESQEGTSVAIMTMVDEFEAVDDDDYL